MHIHKHSLSCQANQSAIWITNNVNRLENNLFIYSDVEAQGF